jgi:hypothetical protein
VSAGEGRRHGRRRRRPWPRHGACRRRAVGRAGQSGARGGWRGCGDAQAAGNRPAGLRRGRIGRRRRTSMRCQWRASHHRQLCRWDPWRCCPTLLAGDGGRATSRDGGRTTATSMVLLLGVGGRATAGRRWREGERKGGSAARGKAMARWQAALAREKCRARGVLWLAGYRGEPDT